MAKCELCGKPEDGFFHPITDQKICLGCFAKVHKEDPQGGEFPQWIYPHKLLSTPQSAFDFPEYPGLSVAMRLYIVVGKISWWIVLWIVLGFTVFYAVGLGKNFLAIIPVSFLGLLLMNLGLAFQFASCEIVKVLIRIENNTRKETVKDSGDE